MAGRFSLQEVDLSCPICCDIFRDPVVLKCSHSFCAPCLQHYWAPQGHSRDCPLCRKPSQDEPVPSLTLKNLCEAYVQESEGAEGAELYADPLEMCPLHGERLKLFCLLDQEPMCVVCHTSRRHKQHDCCPVSEAVVDVKEQKKCELSSLQEKKEALDKMMKTYEDSVEHIQVQARYVERRTREEFEKLRTFLRQEEEVRLAALRIEEELKSTEVRQKMEEIGRSIRSLSESIRALEEEIALDGIAVLHKCKKSATRELGSLEDPVMACGTLIDVAGHLGSLTFHVWEKMLRMVKYTPVTLDPNTAAPWLILSDDLTSFSDIAGKQKLPDNAERFDPDTAVLGRQGFTSGRHTWDVNVGDNQAWVVGVAKESVKRKTKESSVLKNGYLSVYFYHKMYFAGTSPLTRINLKRNPQRIRVLLDVEKGRVTFTDPSDNTHIYTFKHAITEKVYPYFWVGCEGFPLVLEPLEVSVKAAEYF
ncbi:E3 ubiquitin-protein ligase TRIM35 [Aulostomus maculatus]